MSKRLRLCLIAAAVLMLMPWNHAMAQQNFTNRDLMLDMSKASTFLKTYYKKNGHLPMQPREQDEVLHTLYKKSIQYNPDRPLPMPNSVGTYRKLGRFQIEYSQSINQTSNTLILWRRTPPQNWTGPAGTIGIITNGEEKFLLYAIGNEGNPIRSDSGLTIFSTYDCKNDTSDERLF